MVTLKDIAQKANCSVSLVSRVLNPKASKTVRVSDTTRRMIEKAAVELGFKQNIAAQFLRQRKTPAIGIFLPRKPNRLISDLVIGLSDEANKHDFPINIFFGQDPQCYIEFIHKNKQIASTGIITYPYHLLDSPEILKKEIESYCKSGGKALLLNNFSTINLPHVPSVNIDDTRGAEIAAEQLLKQKCSKYLLCYHSEERSDGYIERRIDGFSRAMRNAGEDFEIIKLENAEDCLKNNVGSRLGVFCLTDSCALQLTKKAEKADFQIGENFLVIGFDNLYLTEIISPGLSTIHQPFEEMGRTAMRKIVNMIRFGIEEESKVLTPHFVKRGTA
jgi:LacI family transcriptional regulator